MSKSLLSFFFILSFVSFINAQNSPEFELYKSKYPQAHFVRLISEKLINIDLKGDEIIITQETTEEDIYLDESAIYNSKQSLNFSSFFEMEKVEASSFVYENNNYKEIKVTDFRQKDELNNSFHDDIKSVNFVYPNLQSGAKSKVKYKEKIKNPRFLNSFFFGSSFPLINSKVTIAAHKDISLEFKKFNTEGLDINFSQNEKGGKVIYTWEAKNIEALEAEERMPNFKVIAPHIIPVITNYKTKSAHVNLSTEVSDLYAWYYSLVKDINKAETNSELKGVVHELVKDKTTDLEKVRSIYYWVQKNIKYIAFEYALGGFIPREANDIYKKKYGDCKDNSSILNEMLKIAGLNGHLTWIGTRSIPYKYHEVPTPLVDNHMILSYIEGENIYFLDATGRYVPLELPTSFIQGKEALVSMGEKDYKIVEVPVALPERSTFIDTIKLKLNDQILTGKGKAEVSGFLKIDYFNELESKNTHDKLIEFYSQNLRKGNNKFLIDSLTETNKFEYDKNFVVDYSFQISDYVLKSGEEVYVNLNLNREASYLKTKKDRKNDVEYDYKKLVRFVTVFEIPDHLKIKYLPEKLDVSNEFFSSSIEYTLHDNLIVYEHKLRLDFLTLNLNEQEKLNDLIKKIEKAYKEVIVLETKNNTE